MAAYYAFTAIRHNGEVIEPGTKLTKSMLPADAVKHMVSTGSVVDYDWMAEPSVKEIEVEVDSESTSDDNGVNTGEGEESNEGTGE